MIERLVMFRVEGASSLAALRRRLADDPPRARRALVATANLLDEAALVATCERAELYGVASSTEATPGWPGPAVFGDGVACGRLDGPAAARHLLRVASGLESRIVGESHVLGQVADAARAAEEAGTLGSTLSRLFEVAARTGRRVRAETALGRLAGSYVAAAAERVVERAATVGVIGSGALARDLAAELLRRGVDRVAVYARHPSHFPGAALTARVDLAPLELLPSRLAGFDALVAATSSPRTIVDRGTIAGRDRPLLVVDLGVPPNVDESVGAAPGVDLLRLGDLAGPRHEAEVVEAAERIVEAEMGRLTGGRPPAARTPRAPRIERTVAASRGGHRCDRPPMSIVARARKVA